MRIDKGKARRILLEEASKADKGPISSEWEERVERLSKICESSTKTHIAFLGTAMLAKAVDLRVDVFAVKAGQEGESALGAYSARGLGHGVLVPNAPMLGINLGRTGREPLNNQPYFRINRVSRDVPIHGSARPALETLCGILEDLQRVSSEQEAREALRAFIHVRRLYEPIYERLEDVSAGLAPDHLIEGINAFVSENSEGGKRAQAVAAGLMSLFAGPIRVVTSRINDPDRHLPGDVGILSASEEDFFEKVLEVRDKPVSLSDVYHFVQKAADNGVKEATILAVAGGQFPLDLEKPMKWAAQRGVSLFVFAGWDLFVSQVLFWCEPPQHEAARVATKLIYDRLVELEVSERGVALWISIIEGASAT